MSHQISAASLSHGCDVRGRPGHTYHVCDESSYAPLVERPLIDEQVNVYASSREGDRFEFERIPLHRRKSIDFQNCLKANTISAAVTVYPNKKLQKIEGFGGALTDAAAENILSLSSQLQQKIWDDYFSPNGLNYTMVRVPIGGSDFSSRPYALDDKDQDFDLDAFSLAPEDVEMKVNHF